MKDFFKVLTVDDARAKLFANIDIKPELETVKLMDALGRVLAEDILSPINIPGFKRSTMDGYAVKAKDTFGASEGLPAYLNVVGEIRMGQEATENLGAQEAIRISTGGMLPPNCDSVVMVEYTENLDEFTIGVVKSVAPGENIVLADEDVKENELVLAKGAFLRAQDLGVLGGMGVLQVKVFRKPKVGIISTGDEVVPPDQEPKPGQVKDINSYALYGQALERGGIPTLYGIIQDSLADLKSAVQKAMQEQDMVIITGGSSVGTRDVTAKVIEALGEPGVIVHGVSVRPGKPTILGVAAGKPIFGLPGHPVSTMVIFDLFVTPVMNEFQGGTPSYKPAVVRAKLSRSLSSGSGREDYVRVRLVEKRGELWAEPILGKSGLIFTMVKAQGIFKISLDKEGLAEGQLVDVSLF